MLVFDYCFLSTMVGTFHVTLGGVVKNMPLSKMSASDWPVMIAKKRAG